MIRKSVLSIFVAVILFASCDNSGDSKDKKAENSRYFPSGLTNKQWLEFQAAGYDASVWGVVYNSEDMGWHGLLVKPCSSPLPPGYSRQGAVPSKQSGVTIHYG